MNGLTQFGLTLTVAMLPILGGLSFHSKKTTPFCRCAPCVCPNCECAPFSVSTVSTSPDPIIIDSSPLVVGPTPDSFLPKEIVPLQGIPVVETKFTQPAPQPIVQPKPVVAAKPQAAPTFYSSCGPGGCGTAAGSCGPGGCGTGRRGLFGRRR